MYLGALHFQERCALGNTWTSSKHLMSSFSFNIFHAVYGYLQQKHIPASSVSVTSLEFPVA